MRRRCEAALLVGGGEAEVVGFPTTQTRHVTAVLLSLTQSLKASADDGCQGKVCCAISGVPGHNGSTVSVTTDLYLHLSWQTRS